MKPIRKIHVIINPAAGKDEPILNTLNRVFREYEIDWQASVTYGADDARKQAQEAAVTGVDLVACYGGDGTLMEVANGLRHSDVPLGILPGGTGNGMARELGIPFNLSQSAELLCRAPNIRQIDLGQIGDHCFLLHVYTGMRSSQQASRVDKDTLGIFAYLVSVLKVITDPQETLYSLTIDGVEIEEEGIVCLIVNSVGLGVGLSFVKEINPNDGFLDVILVKKVAATAVPSLLELKLPNELFHHWRGREISMRTDPAQDVWMDGEPGGKTPFTAVAIPQALQVIVPEA